MEPLVVPFTPVSKLIRNIREPNIRREDTS